MFDLSFHVIGVGYLFSHYWPRAVAVSNLDFDSSDRGSHAREASRLCWIVDFTYWCWICVFTILVADMCFT